MTNDTDHCPKCGSGAWDQHAGVCSTCGYIRRRDVLAHPPRRRRRKDPARCLHRRVERVTTPAVGEVREKCKDCGTLRQVER